MAPVPIDPLRVLDALPDPAFVVDADGTLLWTNPQAELVLGWLGADWMGRSIGELLHPDDLNLAFLAIESVQAKGLGGLIDVRVATADGTWKYLEIRGAWSSDGRLVVIGRDVTDRRYLEVSADDTERFRALVHHSAALLLLVDADGVVRAVSGAVSRILGRDPETVLGNSVLALAAPGAARERLAVDLRAAATRPGVSSIDTHLARRDGHDVPMELRVTNLADDPLVRGLIVAGTDVTRLVDARRALEHLAAHDELTGCANRLSLHQRVTEALPRRGPGRELAALFIDIDRFKAVNDLYGHDAGDRLLRAIADRLRAATRPGDLVARFGGDEFVVVAEGLPDRGAADEISGRLEAAASGRFDLGDRRVEVSVSVGWAVASDRSTPDGLIAEADAAMYVTRNRRRGVRTRPLGASKRRWIASELPAAIEDGQLVVHYQPIVRLGGPEGRRPPGAPAASRIVGAEALVRWEHPARGLIRPDQFVDVAEEAGLGRALGEHVLADAVAVVARLNRHRADDPLVVTVNITASHLHDPAAAPHLAALAAHHRIEPAWLCVEITEDTVLERAGGPGVLSTEVALDAVHQVGVRVAMDDFGIGQASLAHLRTLPIDLVKLDRSFVQGAARDPRDAAIVQGMVVLGDLLGLGIVAEGVETEDEARSVARVGCRLAQGFLFGRPAPAESLEGALGLRRGA